MIRGTTPTLEFSLPFDTAELAEAYVTFAQRGRIRLDIPLAQCEEDGSILRVRLTQEQTLALTAQADVEIQIRCRDTVGNATASEIVRVDCGRILKEGEI